MKLSVPGYSDIGVKNESAGKVFVVRDFLIALNVTEALASSITMLMSEAVFQGHDGSWVF